VIVLDTNVLSELMRTTPTARVVHWLDRQPATSLFITAITQAEILHGIELMPKSKRRDLLAEVARTIFEDNFADRVLSFSGDAAAHYAAIAVARRRAGRPIAAFDAQIAAIVRSHAASLATRNTDDFDGCGIDVIDPWTTRS